MINPMDLAGKHIVVTGASSGIGQQICIQASKLGARVSLIARNEEKLKFTISQMEGINHSYYCCDLMNVSEIETLVKTIVETNGPIDGVVHSAGISTNRPIKMLKNSFVEDMMTIHYFSFIELIRCFSSKNNYNEGAVFIGVSSVAAFRAEKSQAAYAAAKGAMNSVIHPLARELAVKNIRINTIAFGMVDTEMYRRDFIDVGGNNDELIKTQFLGIIDSVYAANAVCFMLSDVCKYLTGQTICYDAGSLS